MKRLLSIFFLIIFVFSCSSCDAQIKRGKEITCEEIERAYLKAGYYVEHYEHKDEGSIYLCHIVVRESEDAKSDHVYFTTYWTEEEAIAEAKQNEYNVAVWFYALVMGEARWLKSGSYNNIAYSYYDSSIIKPFHKLIQ